MGEMGRRVGKAANLALLLGATVCVALFIFLVWRHGMSSRYEAIRPSQKCS